MELFDVVFYPIYQLFNMVMSSDLEASLGFSVPSFLLGLFIVSAVIGLITGGIGASVPLLVHRLNNTPSTGKGSGKGSGKKG